MAESTPWVDAIGQWGPTIPGHAIDMCGCGFSVWRDAWSFHRCPLHTAAPELLEALEQVQELAGHMPDNRASASIYHTARAAIAKARGES